MAAVTDTHGAGFSLSSVTTQGLLANTVLSPEPAIVLTGSDFAVSAKAYRVRVSNSNVGYQCCAPRDLSRGFLLV